ncbi:MAG: nitronate monooxygenase [Chloroflexi bacterium]|nr:MAG: nitronate monooxygenase [Chloroflexota bacterium]
METAFTRLVGVTVPLQLAGMGSILSPELAAAVSNAGGLGQVTFAGIPADEAKKRLDRLAALTARPFGVNLLIPYFDEAVFELASRRARVIDFFWGDPDASLVRRVHAAGALASWQVGSAAEAKAAEAAGCDFIIAQGIEAGGHIRGRLGLLPLLSEVLDRVSVPVLAAGGIGSARSVAAVLAAGAAGVRVGTRFIVARESNAHPDYVKALIAARAEDSVRTDRFHVECPLCPSTHGVLRSALEAADSFEGEFVAEADIGGERRQVRRFQGTPPFKAFSGRIDAMAQYAGQSVGAVTRVQPAAEIVAELFAGVSAPSRSEPVSVSA